MNASAVESSQKVVPASLSLLAIYNPTLATNEDTLEGQIAYYYSRDSQSNKRDGAHGESESGGAKDDEHEKQRQIGLAQAMISFAK
jgi:hypothetical protein